jgi:hypothetical protein
MISLNTAVVAAQGQISADLGGEIAILNLNNGVYYGLDIIGARIWELIQEPKFVLDLLNILLEEYEVEPDRCEREILALLEQLVVEKLIEVKDGTTE